VAVRLRQDLVPAPDARLQRAPSRLAYGHILVPLVDRTVSEQATVIACQLADRGATVTAVTVIEVPMELPLHAHMEDDESNARSILAEAAAIGDLHRVTVVGRVVRARAAGEAIVEASGGSLCDIIVLSAPRKKRAGAHSPMFGRTVDFVLRNAACRVMVAASPAGR
jgi:nucleotide-binding universal stress UspA family protein